ncbi:MAG: hypothetical protein J3K34DRAFT_526568 [Monoraphidium minutum]|nr:MAG: hypothetical protein J3K34DRAFT_526568 [Monoraphidium minutum]
MPLQTLSCAFSALYSSWLPHMAHLIARLSPAALQTQRLASRGARQRVAADAAKAVRLQLLLALLLLAAAAGGSMASAPASNVLGGPLKCCCTDPMTGYYRDGFCRTGGGDMGVHVVCAQVTEEFLAYTASRGNDLSSPTPWGFPGLKPGDRWCLCASRWAEAKAAGKAPPVVLAASHVRALDYVDLADLMEAAVDADEAAAEAAAAKEGRGAGGGEGQCDGGGAAAS